LSFASDYGEALYRHRKTGLVVPCPLSLPKHNPSDDLRTAPYDEMPADPDWCKEVMTILREEFDFIGVIQEHQFKSNLRLALSRLSPSAHVFFLSLLGEDKSRRPIPRMTEMNRWLANLANDFPNLEIIHLADNIQSEAEIKDELHFDRAVYLRIYEDLYSRIF